MNIFRDTRLRNPNHCCKNRIENSIFKMSQGEIFRSSIHFCKSSGFKLSLLHNISLGTMFSSDILWFSSQQTSQGKEIDNMWFSACGHTLSDFLSTEIVFPSVGPFSRDSKLFFKSHNTWQWLLTYIINTYNWWHREGKLWLCIWWGKEKKVHISS